MCKCRKIFYLNRHNVICLTVFRKAAISLNTFNSEHIVVYCFFLKLNDLYKKKLVKNTVLTHVKKITFRVSYKSCPFNGINEGFGDTKLDVSKNNSLGYEGLSSSERSKSLMTFG